MIILGRAGRRGTIGAFTRTNGDAAALVSAFQLSPNISGNDVGSPPSASVSPIPQPEQRLKDFFGNQPDDTSMTAPRRPIEGGRRRGFRESNAPPVPSTASRSRD